MSESAHDSTPTPVREITKIGLAAFASGRILLVRKRGSGTWILPGGKPEKGEGDTDALRREIVEELGCGIVPGSLVGLGTFSDWAADADRVRVHVVLYEGIFEGEPSPMSEIEEMRWVDPEAPGIPVAPSLSNSILPALARRAAGTEARPAAAFL